MRVAFNPALGETVHVSVNNTTAELHFIATVSSADYEHIASGLVKLQVWSDMPASGRSPGEWGEAEFNPVSLLNEQEFSLLPVDEQDELLRTTLTLDLSVPVSARRHFSFTYRLVYPTGEIEWLGAYGHNGALVLSRTDSQPVVLGQGWVVESIDSPSHRLELGENTVQDLEVAKLSHPGDYTAWPGTENRLACGLQCPGVYLDL